MITNSLLGAITQPLTQAKSLELKYRGAWEFETSERNASSPSSHTRDEPGGGSPASARALGSGRRRSSPSLGIAALAALCWIVTVQLTRGMGVGPGTMGMSFGVFMGMWVAMMAAMMLPSQAPMAMLWTRAIAQSPSVARRTTRTFEFLAGYIVSWALYGLLAFVLVVALDAFLSRNPGRGGGSPPASSRSRASTN